MNYLITGIAGFVGSSLARAILENDKNAKITGIDNMSYGHQERLADIVSRIEFIDGDLANIGTLLNCRHFDSIIHCAAIAPLPECQRDSHRAILENVAVCGSVVDYALASGSRNIVFFSSGAVYEGTAVFPTPEDVPICTTLIYPTTKHIAEQYFSAMCKSHKINVTAIRLFNLYGPHQDYFRKQPPLIGYLLKCIIRGDEANLFSSGNQCRDYIYIDDLLNLVTRCVKKMTGLKNPGTFMLVNAGSGQAVSVNGIIDLLEQISNRKLKVKRSPAGEYWDKYNELFERPIAIERSIIEGEVEKHTQASVERAYKEYDWVAKVTLRTGLERCLHHARNIIER